MTPKWKLALGHLSEIFTVTAVMLVLFVIMPLGCGQSDRVLNIGGVQVKEPALPFINPRIYGALPGQTFVAGPFQILTPTRFPNVTPATSYTSLGDSITAGVLLSNPGTQAYPALVASALNVPLSNNAISGDQACDLFPRQIATPGVVSHLDGGAMYSLQIGTNDVDVKSTGAYEPIFRTCHQAALGWLGTPRELMVLPGDAAMTATGSCSASPTVSSNGISYAFCGSTGTITTTLQTFGAPIYGWYYINDSVAISACFTVAVDGVQTGARYCTGTSPRISTQNGTTASVAFIRLGAAAGTHTIVITNAGAGNAIGLLGWGTPIGRTTYFGHPVILSGDIPNQLVGGGISTPSAVAQYNADVAADESLFVNDSTDLRHVPNQAYMLGSAGEMTDPLHPNVLGNQHLASSYLQVAQVAPKTPAAQPYLLCTASCTPSLTQTLVYAVGNNITVTLPPCPVNTGSYYAITVNAFQTSAGTTIIPASPFHLIDQSSTVQHSTLSLAPTEVLTFSCFNDGLTQNWIQVGGTNPPGSIFKWLDAAWSVTGAGSAQVPTGVKTVFLLSGATSATLPIPTGITSDPGSGGTGVFYSTRVCLTNITASTVTLNASSGSNFLVSGATSATQSLAAYGLKCFASYKDISNAIYWNPN